MNTDTNISPGFVHAAEIEALTTPTRSAAPTQGTAKSGMESLKPLAAGQPDPRESIEEAQMQAFWSL